MRTIATKDHEMNDLQLRTLGRHFAARHAHYKVRQERDEAKRNTQGWAAALTWMALAFTLLMAIV